MKPIANHTDLVVVALLWASFALPAALFFYVFQPDSRNLLPAAAMLATALPLYTLFGRYDRLAGHHQRRSHLLAQHLMMLRLTEGLAQVGRWVLDLGKGWHEWSDGFARMVGHDNCNRPEKALLGQIMPDGGASLSATLKAHGDDTMPFTIEFDIVRADGQERVLRARAQNEFDDEGDVSRVLMIVQDVTDQYRRLEAVERACGEAVKQAEEAQKLANTDALTGLSNRRHAMAELDRMILECRKNARGLAMILFDLDHFKLVNDTYGHGAGDRMLVRVARLAQKQTRKGDLIGRIGGEEFIWLLPGVGSGEAELLAERLRYQIERGSALDDVPAVTASFGHASWTTSDVGLTLFARADAALYEAKSGGRNRVRKAA